MSNNLVPMDIVEIAWVDLVKMAKATGAQDENIAVMIDKFDDLSERKQALFYCVNSMLESQMPEEHVRYFIAGLMQGIGNAN